jgi:hypothetical protein
MRENRLYGSEGGGTGTTGPSYPYQEALRDMDSRFRSDFLGRIHWPVDGQRKRKSSLKL